MSIGLSDDERDALERRIDCPVPWCMGSWLEHGGDGGSPETWLHEERHGTDLGHGAFISRSQEGAGPVVWSFAMDRHNVMEASQPGDIARRLRELADRLDAL